MLAALVAVLLLPIAVFGEAPSLSDVLLTDKDAFLLLAPELIAAPTVKIVAASANGKYILAVREELRIRPNMVLGAQPLPSVPTTSLVAYDAEKGVTKEIWKSVDSAVKVVEMAWMPGTNNAFVLVLRAPAPDAQSPGTFTLLRISRMMISYQYDSKPNESIELEVSPDSPCAYVELFPSAGAWDPPSIQHWVFDVKGEKPLPLKIHPAESVTFLRWQSGATALFAEQFLNAPTQENRPALKCLVLDLLTGESSECDSPPPPVAETTKPLLPLEIGAGTIPISGGDNPAAAKVVWLGVRGKSSGPKLTVCTDAEDGQIIGDCGAIVYHSQGALWIRPIARTSRDQYEQAAIAAKKTEALSTGKQIGIAIVMFASDNDDAIPGAASFHDDVLPYLKTGSLLDNFVYTGSGGTIAPTMELGYIPSPGGRAVLFGDGHVEWKAD